MTKTEYSITSGSNEEQEVREMDERRLGNRLVCVGVIVAGFQPRRKV